MLDVYDRLDQTRPGARSVRDALGVWESVLQLQPRLNLDQVRINALCYSVGTGDQKFSQQQALHGSDSINTLF